jgi:hypothetical protein
MTPVSLFASIIVMRLVVGRMFSKMSSTRTIPCEVTGTKVASEVHINGENMGLILILIFIEKLLCTAHN